MNLIEKTKEHFTAVIDKRIDDILNFYADSPDLLIFVEGPRWATHGFANVAKGWRDFCDSAISMTACEWIENLEARETDRMGFVGGVCELKVSINGEPKTIRFRGTFVFEKDRQGNWKVVHEHFSQPAADPYGIGDWLKTN